jgi:glucose dehydrogenase
MVSQVEFPSAVAQLFVAGIRSEYAQRLAYFAAAAAAAAAVVVVEVGEVCPWVSHPVAGPAVEIAAAIAVVVVVAVVAVAVAIAAVAAEPVAVELAASFAYALARPFARTPASYLGAYSRTFVLSLLDARA